MIERNRHERMPWARLRMLVKGLGQPLDQPPLLVILIAILETNDGFADLALRAVSGACPFEMPLFLRTIVANESGLMELQGGIGITALLAKRALDPHGFRLRAFGPGKGEIQGAFGPVPGVLSGKTEG